MDNVIRCLMIALSCLAMVDGENPSFEIDYANNQFSKDGKPYRYIAGSMHYFRIPEIYWRDRLYKVRAAGLNAIQTYVAWNLHEPLPGKFNFNGMANITKFLSIAHEFGLSVILRPGPYICAEWENGGLPWWLLKEPNVRMRTADPAFLNRVKSWFSMLMTMLRPFLYNNGGPIIMIQVENEYGSFRACDQNYMTSLTSIIRQHVGEDTVLFTTDGALYPLLKCGSLPGVYPTVDFGPTNYISVEKSFAVQRLFAPHGPLVNSEFYPGWFDTWGKNHSATAIEPILATMEYMWFLNASFAFYLFHGGTNFGFMNGASNHKMPVTTSYDFDAPLSEAGDLTPKFIAIRAQIEKLTGIPNLYPLPPNNRKINYGKVGLESVGRLTSLLNVVSPMPPTVAVHPLTFEQLNWPYGFVLYENLLPHDAGQYNLLIFGLKDRAYVMVNDEMQAILSGIEKPLVSCMLTVATKSNLKILVESMGRENFGNNDYKGITGNVTLNGIVLYGWIHHRINIESLFDENVQLVKQTTNTNTFSPTIYANDFLVQRNMGDTFFYPNGWTKGQLYVNGFNVGRYWSSLGPQVTVYLPRNFLKPRYNRVIVLELESPGRCIEDSMDICYVNFIDRPILNKRVVRAH